MLTSLATFTEGYIIPLLSLLGLTGKNATYINPSTAPYSYPPTT